MAFKYFPATITSDGRKVPLISDWQRLASNDPDQLQAWQDMFRDRLTHWGLPTGKSTGVLVLDVDVKDNGFESLKQHNLSVHPTLSQQTISGGAHYVYQYPDTNGRCSNRVKVYPGIDIRGDGGYILVYQMDQTPIAPAPGWLVTEASKTYEPPAGEPFTVHPEIAETQFNECLERIYDAAEGERNHTLNREGFKVAQLVASGAITEVHAREELGKAAEQIGLHPHEVHHTLNSCIRGGVQKPLTSPFGEPTPIEGASSIPAAPVPERWTPPYFTIFQLNDKSKLKRPQLFKDWSTKDLHITTADGGTGKTTLKIYEAICLALGERFLGFECIEPGKTLFITGEDTSNKLGAMVGAVARQMGVVDDPTKLNTILSSIVVKKDSDLCLINKTKQGFLTPNTAALEKVLQAVEDIKPKMIVFDPISMFWGSEAALNDMALAVSKFMSTLVEKSDACVEMINHMGKQSSNNKDMSQFAGRGGTGLPSHARVSRVLRPVYEDEYMELTGEQLPETKSAMMCNVSKFSDGSPLSNKPFLIVRSGFLFERVLLENQEVREKEKQESDSKRVFDFVKSQVKSGRYPTKSVVVGYFMSHANKMGEKRVVRTLDMLCFIGHGTEKLRLATGPDADIKEKVYIITDQDGRELRV